MITRNFKNLLACMLTASNSFKGMLPVKDTSGSTAYIAGYFHSDFPYTVYQNVSLANNMPGIFIGTGDSAESEDSTRLDGMITSGVSCSVSFLRGINENGNPYSRFTVSVENTGSDSITIKEIGYAQPVETTATQSSTTDDGYYRILLFDRTVLSSPVTIAAGATKTIQYTLTSIVI